MAVRADLSRVTRRLHHAAPYLTVPYSTVPYRVLRCRKNPRLRRSDAVSLQESQGERKPLWETGKNVENSVENLPRRGVTWCGAAAGCGLVWACGRARRGGRWCGTREPRRARWLAFLPREKTLDKLCKSILDWK